jgi:predicted N-formylglutamate amidohydrolase
MWGTTANLYGDARRLPNMLLEIRHDLIDDDQKSDLWAKMTGDCLQTVLEEHDLSGYYEGPQYEFGPEG